MEPANRVSAWRKGWGASRGSAWRVMMRVAVGVVLSLLIGSGLSVSPWGQVALVAFGLVVVYCVDVVLAMRRQRNDAWDRLDEMAGDSVSMSIKRLAERVVVEDPRITAIDVFLYFREDLAIGMWASRIGTELHQRLDPGSAFKPYHGGNSAYKALLVEQVVELVRRGHLDGGEHGKTIMTSAHGREVLRRLDIEGYELPSGTRATVTGDDD